MCIVKTNVNLGRNSWPIIVKKCSSNAILHSHSHYRLPQHCCFCQQPMQAVVAGINGIVANKMSLRRPRRMRQHLVAASVILQRVRRRASRIVFVVGQYRIPGKGCDEVDTPKGLHCWEEQNNCKCGPNNDCACVFNSTFGNGNENEHTRWEWKLFFSAYF